MMRCYMVEMPIVFEMLRVVIATLMGAILLEKY